MKNVKCIPGNWFEVKVKSERMMEDGSVKAVTELYVTDSPLLNSAVSDVHERVLPDAAMGCIPLSGVMASYREIIVPEDVECKKYYKARVALITIDERTGKEKRQNQDYLVNADTHDDASAMVHEMMKGSMADYLIVSVAETKIVEVYK